MKRRRFKTPQESFAARTERHGDCLIWTGAKTDNGYGQLAVRGTNMLAHRFAWEQEHGPIPDGMTVDHREHCDRACVEVKHLRLATKAQNNSNRSGPRDADTKTGVRNVYVNNYGYMVRIGGKYLGNYPTLDEAKKVADEGRKEMYGEYAGRG